MTLRESTDLKRELLEEAHFFVLPTRYNNEGQPVSIIEAMARGSVVVSTDYRAIPDVVAHGETGVLVPYGDPPKLAEAIGRLVADGDLYASTSRAAVEGFRRRFTRRGHLDTILPYLIGARGTQPHRDSAHRCTSAPATPGDAG